MGIKEHTDTQIFRFLGLAAFTIDKVGRIDWQEMQRSQIV